MKTRWRTSLPLVALISNLNSSEFRPVAVHKYLLQVALAIRRRGGMRLVFVEDSASWESTGV